MPPFAFGVQAENCSNRTLMPAASCEVTVTFEPTTVGQSAATLSIEYTNGESNVSFPLSGLGVDPALDGDADSVPDNVDNCTDTPNLAQRDTDFDGHTATIATLTSTITAS